MLGSKIKACKLSRNDLKSGQRHRNDLSVWRSVLGCPSKTKNEVKPLTQSAAKWICMGKWPVPSGAIYFYQVVVVRDAIIGGLGARPLKAYHRWIKIRSTYWYVHMCVCGSHLIIANITHHRQFICWDTYLWYCIGRISTLNAPQKLGHFWGQRPWKEHIPPPVMASLIVPGTIERILQRKR